MIKVFGAFKIVKKKRVVYNFSFSVKNGESVFNEVENNIRRTLFHRTLLAERKRIRI